eukprot:TRINITY_DN927_c0_g6_i1.p2 TRINITY_DN927_c0_g6~~TRINITY_DN927_c0_g6_i1.p2  ORF type:complete len:223 (-),score=60.78 TRINITY_DN927_c0_g6_i1:162-830(-)
MSKRVCSALVGGLAAISAASYGSAFLLPTSSSPSTAAPTYSSVTHNTGIKAVEEKSSGVGAAMAMFVGAAHLGLAVAMRSRSTARQARPDSGENQAEARLFEQVFMDYTSEYLKGPMYWVEEKKQYFGYVQDPDYIEYKNGKMTNAYLQYLKNWTSNELAFVSVLMFGLGLYGNLMWNVYDPQWSKVDDGGAFNAAYIAESFCLFPSFLLHLACYIQKQNGK